MKGTKKQSKRQSKRQSKKQSKKHRQKGGGVPSVIRNIMEFLKNVDDTKNNQTRIAIYKILNDKYDQKWNYILDAVGRVRPDLFVYKPGSGSEITLEKMALVDEFAKIDQVPIPDNFTQSSRSKSYGKKSYTPLEAKKDLDEFMETMNKKVEEEAQRKLKEEEDKRRLFSEKRREYLADTSRLKVWGAKKLREREAARKAAAAKEAAASALTEADSGVPLGGEPSPPVSPHSEGDLSNVSDIESDDSDSDSDRQGTPSTPYSDETGMLNEATTDSVDPNVVAAAVALNDAHKNMEETFENTIRQIYNGVGDDLPNESVIESDETNNPPTTNADDDLSFFDTFSESIDSARGAIRNQYKRVKSNFDDLCNNVSCWWEGKIREWEEAVAAQKAAEEALREAAEIAQQNFFTNKKVKFTDSKGDTQTVKVGKWDNDKYKEKDSDIVIDEDPDNFIPIDDDNTPLNLNQNDEGWFKVAHPKAWEEWRKERENMHNASALKKHSKITRQSSENDFKTKISNMNLTELKEERRKIVKRQRLSGHLQQIAEQSSHTGEAVNATGIIEKWEKQIEMIDEKISKGGSKRRRTTKKIKHTKRAKRAKHTKHRTKRAKHRTKYTKRRTRR